MTTALQAYGPKPIRWSWQPGLVSPIARGLLRDCVFLVPFWEGGGTPQDLIRHPNTVASAVGTNVWQPSRLGLAYMLGESDDYLDLGWNPASGQTEFSTFFMGVHRSGSRLGLWDVAGTTTGWNWLMRTSVGGNTLDGFVDAGGQQGGSSSYTNVVGEVFAATMSFRDDHLFVLKNGGVEDAVDASTGTSIDDNGANTMSIGGKGANASGESWGERVLLGAAWRRQLRQDELRALHRDPFMLIRQEYPPPGVLSFPEGGGPEVLASPGPGNTNVIVTL